MSDSRERYGAARRRDRLALRAIALGSAVVFGALGLVSGGRGTHPWGVGAEGRLELDPDPGIGKHPFFRRRTLRCVVRHAGFFDDDTAKQIRSCALQISDGGRPVLDLPMNSGEENAFWDLESFADFVRGAMGGVEGNRELVERRPEMRRVVERSLRRTPESYAAIHYHSKLVLGWQDVEGGRRWVRFRIVPEDGRDTGFAVGEDLARPWEQDRLEGETRPRDYLRRELEERVLTGAVRYHLECQLREPGDPEEASPAKAWELPWLRLGELVLTRLLSPEAVERLQFRVDRLPEGLQIPRPVGLGDPAALTRIRTATYPVAQVLRRVNLALGRRPARPGLMSVRGQVVHADREGSPLHHVRVEVWSRGLRARQLGSGLTDWDGAVAIEISTDLARATSIELRVIDESAPQPACIAKLGVSRRSGAVLSFGTIRVAWWEYDPSYPFARTRPGEGGRLPDRFGGAYIRTVLRQNLRSRVRRDVFRARGARSWLQPRWSEVHRAWPVPAWWSAQGDEDAALVEQLLNGFYPCLPRREGEDLVIRFGWTQHASNGNWDLSDAEVRLRRSSGRFRPVDIALRTRLAREVDAGAPERPWRHFSPDDPEWPSARRALRAVWALEGEVDAHLCAAHLNIEQYALPAHRHLRRSPIAQLLRPHLTEVAAINRIGDQAVFGPQGVLSTNAPLTGQAALERFVAGLGKHDWRGWRPRRPLGPEHRFARAAQLFWAVTLEHVEEFIAEHRDAVVESWPELRRFSEDLVRNAVPLQPVADRGEAYDPSELPDPAHERVVLDGEIRAISPLTRSDVPQEGELAALGQLCAYVIFHATFFHTWENDLQRVDGGDPRKLALGLRGGSFGPVDDPGIPPSAAEATNQLYFVNGLSSLTPGLLVDGGSGAPHTLGARIARHRSTFAELGVDVGRIRSRINI